MVDLGTGREAAVARLAAARQAERTHRGHRHASDDRHGAFVAVAELSLAACNSYRKQKSCQNPPRYACVTAQDRETEQSTASG